MPFETLLRCNQSLKENSRLEEENRNLKISLMRLKDEAQENKRLRGLFSFKEKSNFTFVAAKVLFWDSSNFKRSLVINKGRSARINIGDSVITEEGMVGVVVEVSRMSSRVMLINDLDFSMAAKIERSHVQGVLCGSLSGMCKLKYLELDEDAQIGDQVSSASTNSRFPPGIPIGKIVEVSKENSGLTLFAVVKPMVKLSSLEEVLVVTEF